MSRAAVAVLVSIVGVAATFELATRANSVVGLALGGAIVLLYITFAIDQLRYAERMKIRSRYAVPQREKDAGIQPSDAAYGKNIGIGN